MSTAAEGVRFAFGPYKEIGASGVGGRPATVVADGAASPVAPITSDDGPARFTTITWAFATGPCGAEQIAGLAGELVMAANRAEVDRRGIGFIVATGGEGGRFTCDSAAGMKRFLGHYASPHFIGIDFDIEAGQTPAEVDALMAQIAFARQWSPRLRISFTLQTFAATDGSGASLNALAASVLDSARRHRLQDFVVNLMVMDYGEPAPAHCVVNAGACDMGRSAVRAAENLHTGYGVPYDRIELTPMIGVNDTADNTFRLEDARHVARFVRERGLAGLHFWSLDRDAPCRGRVASDCSGLPDVPAGEFGRAFADGLVGPSH